MAENTNDWIKGIQAEAERQTKRRLAEAKEEDERIAAEEAQEQAQADNKKKA